jgi:hypothetical protein
MLNRVPSRGRVALWRYVGLLFSGSAGAPLTWLLVGWQPGAAHSFPLRREYDG